MVVRFKNFVPIGHTFVNLPNKAKEINYADLYKRGEIKRMINEGKTHQFIAEQLGITRGSVAAYCHRLRLKKETKKLRSTVAAKRNKFEAYLWVNDKKTYVGIFDTVEKARAGIAAYNFKLWRAKTINNQGESKNV